MTRRDLIIVAALANVGVLAVLFMLAFRTEEEQGKEHTEIAYTLTEEPKSAAAPIEIPVKPEPMDMVDTALDDEGIQTPSVITGDDDNFQLLEPEKPQEIAPVETPKEPEKEGADTRFVEVTIKRGDALEKIARANGTTVEAIMKANNLKNDRLRIGQTLKVPVNGSLAGSLKGQLKGSGETQKPAANPPKDSPKQVAKADSDNKGAQYYTIKSGDNPWKIAKQFNLKLDELLKLNNLDQEKARNLKVGDSIRVK